MPLPMTTPVRSGEREPPFEPGLGDGLMAAASANCANRS